MVTYFDLSYYYSKDGVYTNDLISHIGQFQKSRHFKGFDYEFVIGTTDYWIKAQKE